MLSINKYILLIASVSIVSMYICSCSDDYSEDQGVYDSQLNICVIEDGRSVDFGEISDIDNLDIEISNMTEERALSQLKDLSEFEKGNIMYSPIASTISYAMMMNTTDEKKQDEIKKYIGISDKISIESANKYCRKLIAELNKDDTISKEKSCISINA